MSFISFISYIQRTFPIIKQILILLYASQSELLEKVLNNSLVITSILFSSFSSFELISFKHDSYFKLFEEFVNFINFFLFSLAT